MSGMLKRLAARSGASSSSRARGRNIVLTGPGRSGTTLTCYLLNKLPDTVALSEPISPGKYADRLPDLEAVADGIEDYYRSMREMALERGQVISKHVGGKVPDNSKGMKDGVRQRIAEKGRIPVGKDLTPDFYLAIKQPAMFTALLPTLVRRFPCFAIIRNPLSVVASTSTVQRDRDRKNLSAKVRYDPEFGRLVEQRERTAQEQKDPGEREIYQRLERLSYSYERYRKELPEEHVLRYEDIVASGGRALSVIVPAASTLDEPLENKNFNPIYDREKVLRAGERLLASDGAYWSYYSRRDVEEIMDEFD